MLITRTKNFIKKHEGNTKNSDGINYFFAYTCTSRNNNLFKAGGENDTRYHQLFYDTRLLAML